MILKFTVPGEPKAKARPRVTRTGHAYTPKETAEYENLVRVYYNLEHQNTVLDGYIHAHIIAYFGIPKSFSKKKQTEAKTYKLLPTKKPDLDNIAKAILDSLNGIAYKDDSQVVELTVSKYYAENPRVEVILEGEEHEKIS